MKKEAILADPASAYAKPSDVLKDQQLTDKEKIDVLERWEYDARELQVATEENMPGQDEDVLEDILKAKSQLQGDNGSDIEGDNKHGS